MFRAILTLALVALTAGCANTDWQAEKQVELEFQMYEAALDVAARDCGVGEQVSAVVINEFEFEFWYDVPQAEKAEARACIEAVMARTFYADYD